MVMKKILLFATLVCVVLVGCKSKEDKAQELIDQYMFKNLFDYSSYEPVETIIDSAFTNIYRDPEMMQLAASIVENLDLMKEATEKANSARSYAEIYADSYYSSGQRKFNEYKAEALAAIADAKVYMSSIRRCDSLMRARSVNFPKNFIGWEVNHRFRSKNRGGNFTLGDYVFIFDPKITTIMENWDIEDEDEKKIRDAIQELTTGEPLQ